MCVRICMHMHVCVYVCTHVCMHVQIITCVYICMCICIRGGMKHRCIAVSQYDTGTDTTFNVLIYSVSQ